MKTTKSLQPVRKSTYALLVRAEENDRGLFETFVYGMLVLSAVIGVPWLRGGSVRSSVQQHRVTPGRAWRHVAGPGGTTWSRAYEPSNQHEMLALNQARPDRIGE